MRDTSMAGAQGTNAANLDFAGGWVRTVSASGLFYKKYDDAKKAQTLREVVKYCLTEGRR